LTVWGWGANNYGQLGDGSNSMALLPVQTAGLSGQTMIAAGEFHSSSVIAVKTATTTTPKNLSFVYGKPVVLSAVIKSSLSVALAQKAIDFSLDGIPVGTGISDASGKAIVTVGNPLAFLGGSHAIVASFAGDILLLPSQGNATLTVTPSDTTLTAGNVTGRVGDTKTLIATLKRNSNNKPMINKTVYFKSAGTLLGTAMTDGFGKATLMYAIGESFGVGVFPANAGYDGDASHNASSASFTLTINQSPTLLSQLNLTGQRGATVVLTATLKRTTDNVGIAGRSVRFEVQAKPAGQAITGANGVATLNFVIPANFSLGNHKMTVKFDGDALYLKYSNVGGVLTVNP
ncbi:MAG: Ig-like domain repeat protein, partial [Armatimonadetes bacterium]|nr:Ig-like domain repeat protein [Armatimonadota bacterium]